MGHVIKRPDSTNQARGALDGAAFYAEQGLSELFR